MGTKLEKPTAVSEDPRYYTLDGMRGVAALMVVHFHYVLVAGYVLGDQHKMQAYLAVDLFFALSGFVIALSYSDKLASALSISGFVKRRLIRLYPLYIFGIALGLSIEVARALSTGSGFKISEWAVEFGFNLFFLPSFQHEILFPLNLPAWSLFYEMAVNIIFAWVLWRVPAKLLASMRNHYTPLFFAHTYLPNGCDHPGHKLTTPYPSQNTSSFTLKVLKFRPVFFILFK